YTDNIIDTIRKYLPKKQADWELVGLVNKDRDIFAFGNDSKIVGRLFEIVATSFLRQAANELGYSFHESTKQTVYPDFWFEKADGRRIAVDVKSTYRQFYATGKIKPFNFTQGSFTSYLRNNTKNIDGTYDLYDAHYILAFLYTRDLEASTGMFRPEDIPNLTASYKDTEIVIAEKYRIGGDKKGSGNTDNISTFKSTDKEAFNYGAGPFSFLGENVYEHYWRHYPRYTDSKEKKASLYNDLQSYFEWLASNGDQEKSDLLKERYEDYKAFVKENGWNIIIN
ncbi:MAG: hypothetical protein L0L39_05345, partial [Atopostipes suicloacalis]|nr:hypothetical protein [Atopostipes suicloacalis]